MHTYNATVHLGEKLENQVDKHNLTAPEILILRRIHGGDGDGFAAVRNIVPNGKWDDHFSVARIMDNNGKFVEISQEYDDEAEKERLAHVYGEALMGILRTANPRAAVDHLFGTYAPLPQELPELAAQRKAQESAKKLAAQAQKQSAQKPAPQKPVPQADPEETGDDDLDDNLKKVM